MIPNQTYIIIILYKIRYQFYENNKTKYIILSPTL